MKSLHLTIRGLKTAWLDNENHAKPLLIFLHGYPDTPHIWDRQFDHFTNDYHIIAPFSRGVSPSETTRDVKRFRLSSTVLDLLAIVKKVNPNLNKEIFVVGHDMGGCQAWEFATYLPKRLKKLCIINSISVEQMKKRLLSSNSQRLKSSYIAAFNIPFLPEKIANLKPHFVLDQAHKKLKDKPKRAHSLKGVIEPIKQYKALSKEMLTKHTPPMIKAKTLIVFGDQDPFLNTPSEDEITPIATNFDIRVTSGNHWIQRDQKDWFNHTLDEFLCS